MSKPVTVRVTVLEAGAIPLTRWSNDGCWKLLKHQPNFEDMPPRVLLDVSEEAARALAAHLYEEIEITIKPIEKEKSK